ncbi:G-protein-signaling modulator 2 [Haplochromis burtoni]|uniref:G-protein-signaling modulator 2 n=1 Tax=Haplochromis burtoni TaxID=8153 RepID=UPI0003BC8EF0|nr:G-protein-signaling modulator 2 [Haplochromis burtoni]XP_014189493.1 G-protein-signaling modulator 2 [Haplochromis burtoni]
MAEEELLEPLVIIEDGDLVESITEIRAPSGADVTVQSCSEEFAIKKEEEHTEEENSQQEIAGEINLEEQSLEKQQITREEDKPEITESTNDGLKGNDSKSEGQPDEVLKEKTEKLCSTEDEKATQYDPEADTNKLNSSELQPEGGPDHKEDLKKAHRLTPDFPEALYDLLCTFQEGRRLNDQRCSFRLESGVRRRRCHSEPNTSKPVNRVVFSSMTSLQKEEFFDLVATAQGRRLEDQRAQLGRSSPPKTKTRSVRGSIRQLSLSVKKPAPVPAPKDDLYDMILTTQAQGRLEDQRSRAPGPMDDEDFFSLLLRVQGGRMDEQRTELPRLLQT